MTGPPLLCNVWSMTYDSSEDVMTVADLIDHLSDLDQEMPVVLSRDPEGNGFRYACNDLDIGKFDGREFISDQDDDAFDDFGGPPAVLLW